MDRKTTYVLNSVVRELFEDEASLDASGGSLSGRLPDGTEVHTNIAPAIGGVTGGINAYRDAHTPSLWRRGFGAIGDLFGIESMRNVRDDVLDPRDRAIQKGVESVQDNIDAYNSAQIERAVREKNAADAANAGPGLFASFRDSRPVRWGAEKFGQASMNRDIHHWGTANLPPIERAGKNAGFEAKWIGSTGDGKPVGASTNTAIQHAIEDVAGQNDPWYTKGMREMRQGAENIGASMADHPWLWGGGLGAAALAAGAGAMYLRKKKKEANGR